MAHVYRADTIGSLLRPPYLKLAREQFEAGQLGPAEYKEIEDRAVDQAIAMQEGASTSSPTGNCGGTRSSTSSPSRSKG